MTENENVNDQQKNQGGNKSMKEDINRNDNKTDEKTEPQRAKSGQFLPGCEGGPGRGKKADEIDLTNLTEDEVWALIEGFNRQDLASSDVMTRQRAVKIKIIKDNYLLEQRAKSEAQDIMTPEVIEFLEARRLLPYFGGVEGLKKMLKVCPGCSKVHVTKPRVFNLPGDTEEPGGGPELMGPIDT